MRNPVEVVQLESSISRFNFKDMKQRNSWRCRRLSGFRAIAEMMNVLRILWEAFLPIALLWWNAILCACCGRYYSWKRSRIRLECAGHQVFDEALWRSDVRDVQQGLLCRHQSADALRAEMTGFTCDDRNNLHARTPSGQAMKLGRMPDQKDLALQAPKSNAMYVDDVFDDSIAMNREGEPNNEIKEHDAEVYIVSCPHGSKSFAAPMRSDISQLSSLSFVNTNMARQPGLLKTADWSACICLLPTKAAFLAINYHFSRPDQLFESFWMRLTLHLNRNLMDGKEPMQLLRNICIKLPTLEGHRLISIFLSSILSIFDSNRHVYVARQIFRTFMSKASFMDVRNMRLATSFSCGDIGLARNTFSLETLKKYDCLSFDLLNCPLSARFPDLKVKDYSCQTLDEVGWNLDNEEDVFDNGYFITKTLGQFFDGCDCNDNVGFHSNVDLIQDPDARNACQNRLMTATDIDSTSASCSYDAEVSKGGKEVRLSHDISDSENSDVRDLSSGCVQLPEEEDGVFAGYYDTHGELARDFTYFQGRLESDDTGCNVSNYDNGKRVNKNSAQLMLTDLSVDTWWDEDAVLVGEQELDEDSMDQTWQMV